MSLQRIRKEAELIEQYADRIKRSDPTGHVVLMGSAAGRILAALDRVEDPKPANAHQTTPGRMTFTTLQTRN